MDTKQPFQHNNATVILDTIIATVILDTSATVILDTIVAFQDNKL